MVKSTERSGREGRIWGRWLEVIAGVYNEMGDEKRKLYCHFIFMRVLVTAACPDPPPRVLKSKRSLTMRKLNIFTRIKFSFPSITILMLPFGVHEAINLFYAISTGKSLPTLYFSK